MIVCQYFLQGRCRFGQNCRFEHSYTNDDKGSRVVINAQQLHDVLSRITEEVMMAEKGGQWPLSCFAPLRGKPNFPGFEDISPEELRWKTYQAKANGTWDQCLNEIKELYANVERMRSRITMPTKETLTLLVNVLKSKKEPLTQNQTTPPSQNIFGAQPTGQNDFGTPTQAKSIFGGATQQNQNIFGNAPQSGTSQNIFGTPTQTGQNVLGTQANTGGSIFGGSPTTPTKPQGSIFGDSSFSGNVFGNAQTTGNVFGNSPTTGNVFKTNIFSPPTTQGNIFSSSNIFGGSFSQAPFGTKTTTQGIFTTGTGSVFSNAPSQNVFSNFNQSQTGVFQNQGNFSQNIFQSNTQNLSQGENVFKSQVGFGGQQGPEGQKVNAMDSSVYSKMEDLSEDEVNAFKSTMFAFGKIPLKPPPQELLYLGVLYLLTNVSSNPKYLLINSIKSRNHGNRGNWPLGPLSL